MAAHLGTSPNVVKFSQNFVDISIFSVTRARSLDGDSWSRTYRDTGGSSGQLDRSSSVEQLDTDTAQLYRALADYTALTARELNLHAGEVVALVRAGCAGWWYVRLASYPHTEGWAPSTYLDRVTGAGAGSQRRRGRSKSRNRTLDRF